MLTRMFTFEGARLILNISTAAAGSLYVEITGPDGKALPGFEASNCMPVIGDAIEYNVRWKGDPDLGALAGRPVRLKFLMTECDLYSMQFK